MNRHWAITICILSVLTAIIATCVIQRLYETPIQAALRKTNQDIADAQRDDAARKLANAGELDAHARQYKEKLLAAWGGPIEAAVKNPDYGIAAMLEALGKASAPPGSGVQVKVDLFTEFEMKINLPRRSNTNVSGLCLNILRHGLPYLSSLRIFDQGNLVADLDERLIATKADWGNATAMDVQDLLVNGFIAPSARADQPSINPGAEADEVSPERQALKRATDNYNTLVRDHHRRLSEVITCQNQAFDLHDVRSEADMQAKVKALQTNQETLNEVRAFLLHPSGEYERLLQQEKFNALLISILLRKPARVEAQQAPTWEDLLSAVDERQRWCSRLVSEMTRGYGTWQIDSKDGTIRFSANDLRDLYNNMGEQFKTATDNLKAAEANLEGIKNEGNSP